MKGFRPPEYTMTPNKFFDELLPELGYAELKVLLCIFRQTFGWHRPTVKMSVRKIAKATGLSAHHTFDAGVALEARGLVRKVSTLGESTEWEILFEGVTLGEQPSTISEQGVHPAKSKSPVKEIKETIKEKEEEQAQVFRAYSSEIGMLTPMIADSINEWIKDGFPVKWMCDAIHEAALQNKRNWKYCEAIIKRWDAQGSQEEMKKPVKGYKQKPNEPKAFEAIREFMKSQGVDNGDITGSIQNDSAYQRGVPQLECKPIHDPSLL